MRVRNSRRVVATSLAFRSRDIMEEEEEDTKEARAVSRRRLVPSLTRPRSLGKGVVGFVHVSAN